MKHKTLIALTTTLMFFFTASVFADNTIIECTSDFRHLELAKFEYKIVKTDSGILQFFQDGTLVNSNVTFKDFSIRDDINYQIDPYKDKDEFRTYNYGEQLTISIAMFQGKGPRVPQDMYEDLDEMMDEATKEKIREMLSHIKFSFAVEDVAKIKIYDLWPDGDSFTNRFGGDVLAEAFDKDNKLLGRVKHFPDGINGCF